MSDLLENVILLVPVISICSIVFITSINLYIKIRRNFPVGVNCWFCHANTKVPYDQYNSWTCTSCDQYNGFAEDGDYNRDIPAQRSIKLNKRFKTGLTEDNFAYSQLSTPRNGLCEACNRNQEIKVQQLATYEPKDKANFNEEIEHFRTKLEKSYQLCYRCQRILKRTLNRVTNNVIGSKLAQIGAKGPKVFDRSMMENISKKLSKKRIIFSRFILMTVIILSTLNLYKICRTIDITKKDLDLYFPPFITHTILLVISYISAVKLVLIEYLTKIDIFSVDFNWLSYCSNLLAINSSFFPTIDHDLFCNTKYIIDFTAILMSIALLLPNGHNRNGSFLVLFLWSVNMLLSKTGGVVDSLVADFMQISVATSTCIAAIINYASYQEVTPKGQILNNSFHRIYSDCDEDLSENSDEEVSSSYGTTLTPRNIKCNSSIFDQSFNSIKSLSPSAVTNATLRAQRTSSPNILNCSFRSEFQPTHYTNFNQPRENLFHHNNTNDQLYFFPNKLMDPTKKCTSMSALNTSFCTADDCQNKLTGLNISGRNYVNNRTITCSSPTASIVSVNRHRSQLLTPAKLTFNQDFNNHSSLTAPVSQSWVAGGFFVKNSMSPQKRQPQPQTVDLNPILSRTSSQSSGFESRTSSLNNGIGNGSRESSVNGDADHVSIFSEPTRFYDSVSQMGHAKDTNSMFTFGQNTLQRPRPIFPILSDTQSTFIERNCRNQLMTNNTMFPLTHPGDSKPQLVYHQFGTQRRNGTLSSTQSFYNSGSMNGLNVTVPNDLSAIRK